MGLTGPRAVAVSSSLDLTDKQISLIRANCVPAQGDLQRINASDTLARLNLAQQYETISTKLMAPFNSRVALNRLDSVALTQTTVDFNDKIDEFRSLYQQYGQTMTRALEMNCRNQPVAFYDTIALARDHRAAVRETVEDLSALLVEYKKEVQSVRKAVEASTGDES